jgi:microcystin-dependent protein
LTCIIALQGLLPSEGGGGGGDAMTGEMRWFAHNVVPGNFHRCDGSLIPISQNPTLFSILGTTFGGDGRTTFGLPDLQGRSGLHPGFGPGLSQKRLGQLGGTETETLSLSNLPSHNHQLRSDNLFADNINTNNNVLSNGKASQYHQIYHGFEAGSSTTMGSTSLSSTSGGGQAHENMFPFSTGTCVIATFGQFPGRNTGSNDVGQFIGEIRMFGGNYAPNNWALTDGQILPINNFQSLFSLVGTNFGGDGRTTFGIPELRGRIPVHEGTSTDGPIFRVGARSGTETVTLNQNEMPSHTPTLRGFDGTGDSTNPSGNVLSSGDHPFLHRIFGTTGANTNMDSNAISSVGGSQAHNNMSPFKGINYIISLQGVFPSRN